MSAEPFDLPTFLLERAGRLRELFEATKKRNGTRHPTGPYIHEELGWSVIFHTRSAPESGLRYLEKEIKYRHDSPHVVERFEVDSYGDSESVSEEAQ